MSEKLYCSGCGEYFDEEKMKLFLDSLGCRCVCEKCLNECKKNSIVHTFIIPKELNND